MENDDDLAILDALAAARDPAVAAWIDTSKAQERVQVAEAAYQAAFDAVPPATPAPRVMVGMHHAGEGNRLIPVWAATDVEIDAVMSQWITLLHTNAATAAQIDAVRSLRAALLADMAEQQRLYLDAEAKAEEFKAAALWAYADLQAAEILRDEALTRLSRARPETDDGAFALAHMVALCARIGESTSYFGSAALLLESYLAEKAGVPREHRLTTH